MTDNSEIQIFQSADGDITLDVSLQDDTVWLAQAHFYFCGICGLTRIF